MRYEFDMQAASLLCSPDWQAVCLWSHQMQLLPWFTGLTLPHPGKMLPMTKTIVLKYAVLLSLWRLIPHILLIYNSNQDSEVVLEIP